MKGRILAALAAAALLAGAGTAQAQFTQEGAPYTTGDAPYTRLRRRLQPRRAAGRRGDEQRRRADALGVPAPAGRRLRRGGRLAVRRAGATSNGAVGDFNGDGLPDLALAGFVGEGSRVLIRNPARRLHARDAVAARRRAERGRGRRLQRRRARRPRGRATGTPATSPIYLRNAAGTGFTAPSNNADGRQSARRSPSPTSTATAGSTSPCSTTAPRTSWSCSAPAAARSRRRARSIAGRRQPERHHRRRFRRRRPPGPRRRRTPATAPSRSCCATPATTGSRRARVADRGRRRPGQHRRRGLRRQRHARHRRRGPRAARST